MRGSGRGGAGTKRGCRRTARRRVVGRLVSPPPGNDEGGEGDTMVVERERDLALSAQARESVVEIDEALARMEVGTYGYSVLSMQPIPRPRLEAIPWARELVEEKVGGIGRR